MKQMNLMIAFVAGFWAMFFLVVLGGLLYHRWRR